MTARLYLDDALQTFTEKEMTFLKALANSLPKHVNLRATHDAGSLMYLFEIRLAQRGSFNTADAGALERAVLQARATLYAGAASAVEALRLADPRVGNPDYIPERQKCPNCGKRMLKRPGKKRHEYVCVCESGTVDLITEAVIQDALHGRHRPNAYR